MRLTKRRVLGGVAAVVAVAAATMGGLIATDVVCAGPCTPPKPEPAAWPAVTGTPVVGEVLTASNGTWVTSGNHAGHPVTGYSYQWKHCDSAGGNCTNVGSNANTYTIASNDGSHTIRVYVTATNDQGTTAQASAATGVIPPVGANCTRWVSTTGNDSNNGTSPSTPKLTLNGANAAASAGQVWCLEAGTYTGALNAGVSLNHNGSAGNPITYCGTSDSSYCATNDQPAMIDGQNTNPSNDTYGILNMAGSTNLTVSSIGLRNSIGRGLSVTGNAQNITFADSVVHDTQYAAVIVSGSAITVRDNTVYNGALSNTNDAFGSGGWPGVVSVNCPYNPYPTCSPSQSSNITFTGNTIYNGWGEGIVASDTNSSNFSNNTVHDTWSVCIYLLGVTTSTISSNYVYATNSTYYRSGHGCAGIEFGNEEASQPTSTNDKIINNLIAGGSVNGIEYYQYSGTNGYTGLKIAYNTIYGTSGTAINFAGTTNGSPSGTLQNNIVCNGQSGGAWAPDNGSWTITNNDWPNTACTGTGSLPSGVSGNGNTTVSPVMVGPSTAAAATQFKLTTGSPTAVTQGGTPLTGVTTTDFFGTTRNTTNPSMGFHEWPH